MLVPDPKEIIQIPGRVIMLFERDHIVRQIYTDGRGHPKDLNPTYMGDSIGKWEGDTLVVSSARNPRAAGLSSLIPTDPLRCRWLRGPTRDVSLNIMKTAH